MSNSTETLAQAHELQRDLAADGIVLVAFTRDQALALMDVVNFAAERAAEEIPHIAVAHIEEAQNGARSICRVMKIRGLTA
jgi:hypothetical protein